MNPSHPGLGHRTRVPGQGGLGYHAGETNPQTRKQPQAPLALCAFAPSLEPTIVGVVLVKYLGDCALRVILAQGLMLQANMRASNM